MGINCYKISFSDNYTSEIYTKKDLDLNYLKSEIEKMTQCEVVKIAVQTDIQKYDPLKQTIDLYYSVDYDFLNNPMYFNRLLIPKIKDTITELNVNEKMRTFINNVYGEDVKIPSIRFSR